MKLYKGALSRTYWLSLKAESVNCAKRSRPFWDFVLLQMKLDISALRILRSLRRKKCPNRVSVSIFRRSKKSLFYVYIYLKKYLYQMYVINMKFNRRCFIAGKSNFLRTPIMYLTIIMTDKYENYDTQFQP